MPRLYNNLDTDDVMVTPGAGSHIAELRIRRGQNILEFGYVRDTSETTLNAGDPPTAMVLTVKPSTGAQRFDQSPVIEVSSWTKTTDGSLILYTATISFEGGQIDKDLGVDYISQPEVTAIRTVADVNESLKGDYLDLYDDAGPARVWFKVAGAGTAPAAPAGGRILGFADVALNATAAAVATALNAVIDADSKFSSSVASDLVTVTASEDGARTTASSGTTGFIVQCTQCGGLGLAVTDVAEFEYAAWLYLDYSGKHYSKAISLIVENNGRRGSTSAAAPYSSHVRSGSPTIAAAATSKAVTFDTAMPNANWNFRSLIVRNTTASADIVGVLMISAKSAAGFTAELTGPTSATGTYYLDYVCDALV